MKRAAAAKTPREIKRTCPGGCGCSLRVPNGLYYRSLREAAKVTLTEMARVCQVGRPHLSRMERGQQTFQPRFAELYQRLFDRRQKSGDES